MSFYVGGQLEISRKRNIGRTKNCAKKFAFADAYHVAECAHFCRDNFLIAESVIFGCQKWPHQATQLYCWRQGIADAVSKSASPNTYPMAMCFCSIAIPVTNTPFSCSEKEVLTSFSQFFFFLVGYERFHLYVQDIIACEGRCLIALLTHFLMLCESH